MIHPIGDSHAWHAWIRVPGALPYEAGPMTLYHFGVYKPIMTANIPLEDPVVFCWGEIDCRCHIHNHPPYEECIKKLVEGYRVVIKLNMAGRNPKKAWVYNIVPPPHVGLGYPIPSSMMYPTFPFAGNDNDRLLYVKTMNQELKKMCEEEGFLFMDLYNNYCDAEGFMSGDLAASSDHIHVENEKPILEWIEAYGKA